MGEKEKLNEKRKIENWEELKSTTMKWLVLSLPEDQQYCKIMMFKMLEEKNI